MDRRQEHLTSGKASYQLFSTGELCEVETATLGGEGGSCHSEEEVRLSPCGGRGSAQSAGCYGLTTGTCDNKFNQFSQGLPKPATDLRVSTPWEGEETG